MDIVSLLNPIASHGIIGCLLVYYILKDERKSKSTKAIIKEKEDKYEAKINELTDKLEERHKECKDCGKKMSAEIKENYKSVERSIDRINTVAEVIIKKTNGGG